MFYGPYLSNNGRKHIILYDPINKTKRTMSYPKAIMEFELGISVGDLTVDHKDGDFTNDDYDNLQILSLSDNVKKSARKPELVKCICPWCTIGFLAQARNIRHNQGSYGKFGPFCGKSCAGKYGAAKQNGQWPRIPIGRG